MPLRVLFRFCVLYFGLFIVVYTQPATLFLGPLNEFIPTDRVIRAMTWYSPVVEWTGRTVFGASVEMRLDSSSGDQPYMWTLLFCVLILAVAGAAVWSILDRRRAEYRRAAGWFLLLIRLTLAAEMLSYGMAKVIPTQMAEPPLDALLRPLGQISPPTMLWLQVGTSPVYEVLLGSAEVLGGLLLLLPRTALAGVLLSLVSMAQVWILNMTYDVPVKILSFHLLLMSLVLFAPEARRFTAALLGRAVGPASTPEPVDTPRGRRITMLAQIGFLLWFLIAEMIANVQGWYEWGPGAPKSALYGLWSVTEFTRDGQSVAPLTTDETRWQHVVFREPELSFYQRMDNAVLPAPTRIDTQARTLALSSPDGTTLGEFTFDRPETDRLLLTGQWQGVPVTITLRLVDAEQMPLRQNGTHLVQLYPRF
ncbi:DoxX family protein [Nocardia sp. 2]|uniref:DoxX family protein n=1 Tax=Nocardia acididurans TaxID=2802282 RepID=A0ABS1MIE2_9NOCA|nr:DoxX family protein [Nocardia acididurans]